MTSRPVRGWHLLLLPAVVIANYLFMVVRHEGTHSLVAMAFGARVAEFHVWPPRSGNLSWITFGFTRVPMPGALRLQAAAPYALALGLIAASLRAIPRLPPGILRANLVVSGVLFPCLEIGVNAVAFCYAPNDFYFVYGTRTRGLCWLTAGAAAALGIAVVRVVGPAIFATGPSGTASAAR